MGAWNWLDWILAGVVVISVLSAFAKGFTRELVSLAAVLAGLVVAIAGYHRTAAWYEDLAHSHQVALGLGFLTLFLAVLLLGALISAAAKRLIKTAGLEGFDRLLGAAFGLVRGVAVDSILLMAFVAFAIKPGAVQQSALAPYVTHGARALAAAMPGELKTEFRHQFERLRQTFNQNEQKRRS